jgi:hypothetical protein
MRLYLADFSTLIIKRLYMKIFKYTILGMLLLFSSQLIAQKVLVSGSILNGETDESIAQATITLNKTNQQFLSGTDGSFSFEIDYISKLALSITKEGYRDLNMNIQIPTGDSYNMGSVFLYPQAEDNMLDEIPTVVLTDQEINSEDDFGSEGFSGLLSASRDPIANISSFDLSWGRFNMRGLRSEHQDISLNGIQVNDPETNRVYWSNWGGLNAVVRSRTDVVNMNPAESIFGGIAGATMIDMRPSALYTGIRASYARSNGSYRNRLMATYNTGILPSGWGIAVSASRRWAEEGHIEGTFYDAYSYFMSIEKVINPKHSLSLTAFGAYAKRGRNGASIQEAYDLAGDNLYNSYWGYQNGEKRNSRVNTAHQPTFMLNHKWKASDKFTLNTGAYYRTGRYGTSALDWNNAADPRPDYYRYLPSYHDDDPQLFAQVEDSWKNDVNIRQIDWQNLYNVNRADSTFYTVMDANGINGNSISGKRARYTLEERRYDPNVMAFASSFNFQGSESWQLNGGIQYTKSRTENYKILEDLLGADYFLDIDKYGERDYTSIDSSIVQSDLATPNKVAYEGDEIGYKYEIHTSIAKAWFMSNWQLEKWDFFAGLQAVQSSFWRNGITQNGFFPNSSLGESEKESNFTYDAKAGITYKIDGRNYLYANGAIGEKPPNARNGFLSPRVNNSLNPYNEPTKYMSVAAGYQLRSPFIKARVSVFHTTLDDQLRSTAFYNDLRRTFGYYILGNLDMQLQGVEAGFELKASPTISIDGGFSFGEYKYTDRAVASLIDDRSSSFIFEDETVYIDGFYLNGTPMTAASLGVSYNSPKFWWVNLTGNYFDDTFIDINPERRRVEAVELVDFQSELWNSIVQQEKVGGDLIFNLTGGKSWRLAYRKYIGLFLSVNNLLDVTDFISGGYEQYRFDLDSKDPQAFPARYYYNRGRTFFSSITFRF